MHDIRVRLSTLWVFMVLNYLYCDVMTVFDAAVTARLGADALLAFSVLMEIPMAMVVLSRVLPHRWNRWANVLAGLFLSVVQVGTLFVGNGPSAYYAFFTVIEVGTLLFIAWRAWGWAQVASAAAASASEIAGAVA